MPAYTVSVILLTDSRQNSDLWAGWWSIVHIQRNNLNAFFLCFQGYFYIIEAFGDVALLSLMFIFAAGFVLTWLLVSCTIMHILHVTRISMYTCMYLIFELKVDIDLFIGFRLRKLSYLTFYAPRAVLVFARFAMDLTLIPLCVRGTYQDLVSTCIRVCMSIHHSRKMNPFLIFRLINAYKSS